MRAENPVGWGENADILSLPHNKGYVAPMLPSLSNPSETDVIREGENVVSLCF